MRAIRKDSYQSELERFAEWFHQDFSLMFPDLDDGVSEYTVTLTPARRLKLKGELEQLVSDYPGKESKGLRNAWFRLGAQGWPQRKDLRVEIEKWIRALT